MTVRGSAGKSRPDCIFVEAGLVNTPRRILSRSSAIFGNHAVISEISPFQPTIGSLGENRLLSSTITSDDRFAANIGASTMEPANRSAILAIGAFQNWGAAARFVCVLVACADYHHSSGTSTNPREQNVGSQFLE